MPVPLPGAEVVARVLLGVFFVLSGGVKLNDLEGFARIAVSYRLLQGRDAVVRPLAYVLPLTELVTGVFLVVGVFVRPTLLYVVGSLVGYTVLLSVQVRWGAPMENCGCYGTAVQVPVAWGQVGKNLLLLAVAILLLLVL